MVYIWLVNYKVAHPIYILPFTPLSNNEFDIVNSLFKKVFNSHNFIQSHCSIHKSIFQRNNYYQFENKDISFI